MSGAHRRSALSGTAVLAAAFVFAFAFSLHDAAAAERKVIGHAVRLKGTKIFYAHGTAVSPLTVSATVVPVPSQPVRVQWSVVCQKPNTYDPAVHLATSGTSGQRSVHAVATVRLALPYPKPPSCVATVYATLAGKGRLTLRLLQT